MSDILSQSEIDALLTALKSGEMSPEEMRGTSVGSRIRTYDFRRAMRFSKDHLRILTRIHDHFARLMTTHFSGQLRTVVQFQVESVDQLPYEEFIRSIPSLTVLRLLDWTPYEGKIVVEFNPQIVFAMLDRMMGGIIRGPYRVRELTEIENTLLDRILDPMPKFFGDAWGSVAELAPQDAGHESNPQFLQLATSNDTVLVVSLSAKIGSTSGLINICVPHFTIEPLMPRLSAQHLMDGGKPRKEASEESFVLAKQFRHVEVDVSVQLGTAELTVGEFIGMQTGDIITLNQTVEDPITVLVNNVPSFTGVLGRNRGKYAVKIMGNWKEEMDDVGRDETVAGGD